MAPEREKDDYLIGLPYLAYFVMYIRVLIIGPIVACILWNYILRLLAILHSNEFSLSFAYDHRQLRSHLDNCMEFDNITIQLQKEVSEFHNKLNGIRPQFYAECELFATKLDLWEKELDQFEKDLKYYQEIATTFSQDGKLPSIPLQMAGEMKTLTSKRATHLRNISEDIFKHAEDVLSIIGNISFLSPEFDRVNFTVLWSFLDNTTVMEYFRKLPAFDQSMEELDKMGFPLLPQENTKSKHSRLPDFPENFRMTGIKAMKESLDQLDTVVHQSKEEFHFANIDFSTRLALLVDVSYYGSEFRQLKFVNIPTSYLNNKDQLQQFQARINERIHRIQNTWDICTKKFDRIEDACVKRHLNLQRRWKFISYGILNNVSNYKLLQDWNSSQDFYILINSL